MYTCPLMANHETIPDMSLFIVVFYLERLDKCWHIVILYFSTVCIIYILKYFIYRNKM